MACVCHDSEPVPWVTSISDNIQRLPVVRCRGITGRLTELTICAVTI